MCERAKPGDKCLFTGSLIPVPDVTQMMVSGRHVSSIKKSGEAGRGREVSPLDYGTNCVAMKGFGGDGVSGLKSLGCREMTYRLVFMANTAQTSKDKVSPFESPSPHLDSTATTLTLIMETI